MTRKTPSSKIHQHILAISQEDQKVDQALREWRFNGAFRDHGAPTARCGLCGNTGLRYHFRIVNQLTGEVLWVGSQCILNFDLSSATTSKAGLYNLKGRQKELMNQIEAARITKLLLPVQQLYELAGKADQRRIRWAVGKFQRRGSFSPKDLAWLLQAMQLMGIGYQAEDYPLTLRARQDRLEYSQLSLTARAIVAPCLTDAQREKLNR
jgi:hypothetical protein